eukprot:403361575
MNQTQFGNVNNSLNSTSARISKISTKYSIDQKILTNSNFKSPQYNNKHSHNISFDISPRDTSLLMYNVDETQGGDYMKSYQNQRGNQDNHYPTTTRAKTQLRTIQEQDGNQKLINLQKNQNIMEYSTLSQFPKTNLKNNLKVNKKVNNLVLNTTQQINPNAIQQQFQIIPHSVHTSIQNREQLLQIGIPPPKDYKQNYEKSVQSIIHKYNNIQYSRRNHSVDVDAIIQGQKARKREQLTEQNRAGNAIKDSMRINNEAFNKEMDSILHDSMRKSLGYDNSSPQKITLPSILQNKESRTGSPTLNSNSLYPSQAKATNKKSLIFNKQNYEESGSLDVSSLSKNAKNQQVGARNSGSDLQANTNTSNNQDELDPMLVGQYRALKNQDLDRYKQLQKRQVEFNIEDIELSDEENEKQEKLEDYFETQSFLNEIQTEIDLIENEINNAHEEQSKLDKVQETFQKMKDFCAQQLNYNYRDANAQIDRLLKKSEHEVSPLLKFYNELAKNSKFRMPLKALLEFDTKVFQRHLIKLKKAHQVELKWVKKESKDKAKQILDKDYERTQAILKEELTVILEQFDYTQVQLAMREKELLKAYDTIRSQENIIVQMTEYVKHIENRNNLIDEQLGELNNGKNDDGGDVNDQLNKLHERSMLIAIGQAKPIFKDSLLDKPFSFYSTYINLSVHDKETIMEEEIVEYYKSLAVDLQDQVELKENENQATRLAMDQLVLMETEYQKKIERLNNHIERIQEMHAKEIARQSSSYQEVINNQEREIKVLDKELDSIKKIFTAETTVQDQVISRLLALKEQNEYMIGELTLCLRVPRMYHKFLEEHGIHEFVQYCMQIVDRDEKKKQEHTAEKQRLNQRKAVSLEKFVQKMAKDQFSIVKNLVQDTNTRQYHALSNKQSPNRNTNSTIQEYLNTSIISPSPTQANQLGKASKQSKQMMMTSGNLESKTTMQSPTSLVSLQNNYKGMGSSKQMHQLDKKSSAMLQIESKGTLFGFSTNKNSLNTLQ